MMKQAMPMEIRLVDAILCVCDCTGCLMLSSSPSSSMSMFLLLSLSLSLIAMVALNCALSFDRGY